MVPPLSNQTFQPLRDHNHWDTTGDYPRGTLDESQRRLHLLVIYDGLNKQVQQLAWLILQSIRNSFGQYRRVGMFWRENIEERHRKIQYEHIREVVDAFKAFGRERVGKLGRNEYVSARLNEKEERRYMIEIA